MIEGVRFERLSTGGRLSYSILRNGRRIGVCAMTVGKRWGAVPMRGRFEVEDRGSRDEAVRALIEMIDAEP